MQPPALAVQINKERQNPSPDRLLKDRKESEASDPHKPDDARHHDAFPRPDEKPQKRPQNLPAIERIHGKHIEDQEKEIDLPDPENQPEQVGHLHENSGCSCPLLEKIKD